MSTITAPRVHTPGRRKNVNKENVYFEPGKYGRKTGITLKDTGVRDEFGFEPVSGIFSSPLHPSPQRDLQNGHTSLTSSDMVLVDSSVAEPTEVLTLRKTPHLPPKSQTPRHTNIGGSPIRYSSAKPTSGTALSQPDTPTRASSAQPQRTPNRLLDFSKEDKVVHSIEKDTSPFKPRSTNLIVNLNPRTGKTRKSIFQFDLSPKKKSANSENEMVHINSIIEEVSEAVDQMVAEDQTLIEPIETTVMPDETTGDPSIMAANENDNDYAPLMDDDHTSHEVQHQDESIAIVHDHPDEPNIKRKRGRPRRSGDVADNGSAVKRTSARTSLGSDVDAEGSPVMENHSSRKRDQLLLDPALRDYSSAAYSDVSPIQRNGRPSPSKRRASSFIVHPDAAESDDSDASVYEEIPEQTDEPEEPEFDEVPQPRKRARKSVSAKPRSKGQKGRAPAAAKPVRSSRDSERPYSSPDIADTDRPKGPRSIVNLREGTPQDDDGMTVTRSGRTSVKPLKYWCNETFVWRNGEVDGIVRAEEIVPPKRRGGPGRPRRAGLGSIMEDEEEEDLLPEAWEEELGVINGPVRPWDAEIGVGAADEEVDEDIAFASSSIAVRDVQGSAFRYAKVMTMPFFGSGMVEIPPEGYKRSKNSRKMQMVFFVHEGKVTVEVAGMTFGLTKGGVWQVPRGNNYAIANESKRFPAKIFFAQGCEGEPGAEEQSAGAA